jgi:cytochrome c553
MQRACRAAASLAPLLAGTLPASAADIDEKLAPCLACHGGQGQSELDNVPSVGAQTAPYTVIQLFMFREKMRVSDPMNEMANGLTDPDLQAMADAFAAMPPPKPPQDAGDPARLERARALTEQNHCNTCHRPDFSGQQTVPRLAALKIGFRLSTSCNVMCRETQRGRLAPSLPDLTAAP